MLHVCSIFVWIMIKMQRFPLILNEKSTDKTLFCLYEEISFICVTYLFDLRFVLKLQFSFVIYIYIIFTLFFSRRFYAKRLTNEENRSNQNQQKSNNMQVLY